MAKTWSEVADSADFKALAPDAQESARTQYFDQVVAPKVPKEQLSAVREHFDADTKTKVQPSTTLERIGTGMMDPVHGGAQLLTHVLPQGVVEAGNKLNNYLADKGVPLARVPAGGVDQMEREREQQYQAQRAAAGSTGLDVARMAGNVASPANLALAGAPGAGAGLGARAAFGAAQGATQGALQPVTGGGDFAHEKLKQVGFGGALGAAAPAVGQAVSRVIAPKVDPIAQHLANIGVKLTPGQAIGGAFQRLEDAATSIPFLGDAIKNAQRRGIESFNTVAINRALTPIGGKLPAGIKSGHEAVEYAADTLGGAYDALLPKMKGAIDPTFRQELDTVRQMSSGLPPAQAEQLGRIIKNDVESRFNQHGLAPGETVKEIEERLGGMTRDFGRSDNPDVRRLGDATKELQASLRRMLDRSNPQLAPELQKINKGYANLLRVQAAAARQGAKEGTFTPAQLKSASRQLDSSKNKRAFSQGKALMQDLAEAGQQRLSQTVPDSGTPLRSIIGDPLRAGPGLVGAAAYTLGSGLASKVITAPRSQATKRLAEGVRRAVPYVTPALIPRGQESE